MVELILGLSFTVKQNQEGGVNDFSSEKSHSEKCIGLKRRTWTRTRRNKQSVVIERLFVAESDACATVHEEGTGPSSEENRRQAQEAETANVREGRNARNEKRRRAARARAREACQSRVEEKSRR